MNFKKEENSNLCYQTEVNEPMPILIGGISSKHLCIKFHSEIHVVNSDAPDSHGNASMGVSNILNGSGIPFQKFPCHESNYSRNGKC